MNSLINYFGWAMFIMAAFFFVRSAVVLFTIGCGNVCNFKKSFFSIDVKRDCLYFMPAFYFVVMLTFYWAATYEFHIF